MIDAFRIARESVPGLQLALLGLSQTTDDPEGAKVFNTVADHVTGDPDIHLYLDSSEMLVSVDEVVNAVQMASKVLMQKSTREGLRPDRHRGYVGGQTGHRWRCRRYPRSD
ncbi:glycosyl transferase, group 1 [hydrothermal vent metagenome]|uniref:Glycosyl transferase, group 1 n=1 Tax=hydrothermal vent metagenome TaxID=652676 RepID=A0A160V8H1_9ZZZZ